LLSQRLDGGTTVGSRICHDLLSRLYPGRPEAFWLSENSPCDLAAPQPDSPVPGALDILELHPPCQTVEEEECSLQRLDLVVCSVPKSTLEPLSSSSGKRLSHALNVGQELPGPWVAFERRRLRSGLQCIASVGALQ